MSFPSGDRYWLETADFVRSRIREQDKLVAPSEFEEIFSGMVSYQEIWRTESIDCEWCIVHKGRMDEINYNWLKNMAEQFSPVFANEVFAAFSSDRKIARLKYNFKHLKVFWEHLKLLENKSDRDCSETRVNAEKPTSQPPADLNYSDLSVAEIRELMDRRFDSNQAYATTSLWDEIRAIELNKHVMAAISPTNDASILEIGCGIGGMASDILECKEFIGTDISSSAISEANQGYTNRKNFKFIAMDATKLEFEDNRFDTAIAKEVIEHIPNPIGSIQEVYRVLKSGGQFVVTSPNRNSLHLIVNKMLGYADFTCSFDHIKEFTFQEITEILNREGFIIEDTKGVFLMPYWGIPQIDTSVRHLTDNDPAMVETLKKLGERVGAEYAFCYVITCTKP